VKISWHLSELLQENLLVTSDLAEEQIHNLLISIVLMIEMRRDRFRAMLGPGQSSATGVSITFHATKELPHERGA
jgi:hypothetical protein